ncbi:MAG TPA: bifunctional molybdenum cofactor biosynthesis protein MoaC/MoaB [Chlorobaculum sp.]|jgi:molybdenum cofactor biosynthesis protein MoaC|uniref:Molybdenum cofactor biosynthesis bifunctional protein n=1 Tax=Chlorobaculum tepidum (strain ATCC 49652 / DSM 12025 / NBRC 103806 / TLS) TaxID=194439 RepID=MOACB_CHLTE|nr:bifunctional molybdenum cofactor biosynthesis protein MoaC/MoaB [Chlorobaculum tepidum]P59014.1 RecName: Full=Molybdenum cofactor biosynthesis bifunctional protein; Includes: RecName: Full=Cyclic pyranopterin monophosphate synthase; AltName: Full=Molybdenum cofactor biosynthesis protein C; Includes: RecName: Full=Molybdenum cofactor biosynthesis protein B [Chlorobaculum tepidum TLS]AAM72559.1 molybdenum cofactor biosynthesis protein CB [Chlorobaculum tepidum TLS]HBU24583.1 bifunctional molybd
MEFTHLDENGMVRMADVSGKPPTRRKACASGRIVMLPETIALLRRKELPKGNVLAAAKIAGIQAAKQTSTLIPLCHQLNLSWIDIEFEIGDDSIGIAATVITRESTGVEMEALAAVSVAALTIYDMCKAVDKTMEISAIRLDHKTGGKSSAAEYHPRTAILVMSDSIAAGTATDHSGAILREGLQKAGCAVEALTITPDEPVEIAATVEAWIGEGIEFIVTSGGTGLGPRDLAIDTLAPKFTRRLPGVEQELLRWGQTKTRTAMLSRLAAGVIGNTVVVCLPGSTSAAKDALEVLVPAIFHAFPMLKGDGHA